MTLLDNGVMTDHGSHHTGVHFPGDCGLYPAILLDNGVKTDFGSHHTGVHWPVIVD